MATRIAVMKDGAVQQFGTPDQIYDRPANTFVASFMGSPAMNLLDGVIRDGQVQIGETRVPVPASAGPVAEGRAVQIGLRPEWFTPSDSGMMTAMVEMLEPTGPDIYAELKLGAVAVMTRLPAGTRITQGERRDFDIQLDKAVLFDATTGDAIYQDTK